MCIQYSYINYLYKLDTDVLLTSRIQCLTKEGSSFTLHHEIAWSLGFMGSENGLYECEQRSVLAANASKMRGIIMTGRASNVGFSVGWFIVARIWYPVEKTLWKSQDSKKRFTIYSRLQHGSQIEDNCSSNIKQLRVSGSHSNYKNDFRPPHWWSGPDVASRHVAWHVGSGGLFAMSSMFDLSQNMDFLTWDVWGMTYNDTQNDLFL